MATKCPHCDFAADSETQIERHLKKEHSEDGKAFACEHCGKSFALKSNLLSHQKTHDLDKPFGCDKCEKTYKQRNSLREHVLRSHDNISKFICGICYEKFPSRHLLKIHERAHNGEKESIEFPAKIIQYITVSLLYKKIFQFNQLLATFIQTFSV